MGAVGKLRVIDLTTRKHGLQSDGGNLYLKTEPNKTGDGFNRRWVFRYQFPGQKSRDMGLGSLNDIGLARARELAAQYRDLLVTGIDPITHRNAKRAEAAAAIPVPDFDTLAESYLAAHRPGWRNPLHAKHWESSLKTYVSPVIGKLPVNLVTTDHVLKVVQSHWAKKSNSMQRVRGRIERILNFATVRKFRDGDNPATWRGRLSELLAQPSKIAPVQHHAALDYKAIGAFMADLRHRRGIVALALEFTVLTCARSGETRGATRNEIDLEEKTWTIPAGRMKAAAEHTVPLSPAAIAVLERVRKITTSIGGPVAASEFVFPNEVTGRQLSGHAFIKLLARMGRDDVTAHGMRSCFRDWVGEESHFPSDLAELALAHKVGSKVEQAYRRKTGFNKRRLLAEAWANYCAKLPVADSKVLAFGKP
jgi:integrase